MIRSPRPQGPDVNALAAVSTHHRGCSDNGARLGMLGLHQHPPKRPPGLEVPAIKGIVEEQSVAELPACEVAPVEPWFVPLALEAALRDAVEDEPPALVEAGAPLADPEEITDVGTLNGSKPQLGAPKTNDPVDVEQNLIPPGLPPVAPGRLPPGLEDENGLDAMGGAAVTAAPVAALTCAELT